MKKIFSLIMVLLLVAMPIGVFANNETVENSSINSSTELINEPQEEIEATNQSVVVDEQELLSDKSGAEIRLLQLTKHLEARIEQANKIISDVEEKGLEVPEDMLEIIVGFEDALNRIEELDMTQDSDVLAQEYVTVKKEVIDLSKEFREFAKDMFTEDEKNELRAEHKEKVKAKIAEHKEKIEELKNKFKNSQINKRFNALGFDDEELMNKIKSGELSKDEIKDLIKEKVSTMTEEQKKELNTKSLENKKKEKIELKKIHEKREKIAKQKVEKIKKDLEKKFDNLSKEEKEALKERFKAENKELRERFEEQRRELKNLSKEEVQNLKSELNSQKVDFEKETINKVSELKKEIREEVKKGIENNEEEQNE